MRMLKRLLRWFLKSVLMMAVLFAIVIVSQYLSHRYKPGSVLVLNLDGTVVERSSANALGIINSDQAALNVIRRALKSAETDDRIVGLAIKVVDPQMELAQAQELCAMITEFRSHGKWTTAYMETAGEGGFGNLPYLVASAASEISMMPQGEMNILGVGMREMFARGLLEWIKVNPNFASIGKFKSAANLFTEKDFTPSQREEDEALMGDMFDQIVTQSAANRHLAADKMRAIVARAPFTASEGLKSHLLDRLEYEDQFDERVKKYRGEHHETIDASSYMRSSRPRFGGRNKIAVIYGLGAIQRGAGGFDPILSPGSSAMGSDDMVKAFKDAREDDGVRAVVFRVNSPGGSVIASELIRRAVELTAAKKPVVVSMSGYAASGGYWVSTPAAAIISDPGTITGSIGVLGGKFNVAGAAGALGINTGAISHGANALMFDSFSDFTPAQEKIFREQLLGGTYQYFLELVAKQRHLTVGQVNEVAQGRVWTGDQALKVKLVDKLGGLTDAIDQAKMLAKLDARSHPQIEELPEQAGVFSKLMSGQISGAVAQWQPPHALEPLLWLVREVLTRRAELGQVYCPTTPIM
jgi:protease IV